MKVVLNKPTSLLNMPFVYYPIGFIDFCYVITIYIISSLGLAALINGIILPPFIVEESKKLSSIVLVLYLSMIFALQGFLSVLMCAFLELIPSPINGIWGYDTHSPIGIIVRNPAIVTIILFGLSKTLNGIIQIICDRFQDAVINYSQKSYNLGSRFSQFQGQYTSNKQTNDAHDKQVHNATE